jgi:hypothetical protein
MEYRNIDKKRDDREKRRVIKAATKALQAVNREHLEGWMMIHADMDTDDATINEIETICKAINECLDVLKEMLRDLEEY